MEKIMKSTKLVHKILGILFWVVVAVSAVFVFFSLWALLFMDRAAVFQGSAMTFGQYTIKVGKEYTGAQLTGVLWVFLMCSILVGVECGYSIRIIQGILEPMTQGRPFHREVSDGLNKLSYVVLIFGVVGLIAQGAFGLAFDHLINTTTTVPAGVVESHSLWTGFDVQFVVWFFLIRLFRRIFIYGETLQQLSDETL